MNLRVLEERGYDSAMLGLPRSHRQDPARMPSVARRLRFLGDDHSTFLESMVVWLDVMAPRYFWHESDTYRIGMTRQSESTMHTITARQLVQADFAHPVPETHLAYINRLIAEGRWEEAKWQLPESLLQRIVRQRRFHRLPEWRAFIGQFLASVARPELLEEGETT